MKNAKEEKKMHDDTREKIIADHKIDYQERKWAVKVEEVPPIHELPIEDRFEIMKQACDEQEAEIDRLKAELAEARKALVASTFYNVESGFRRNLLLTASALTRWADEIERNEKQNTNSTKENTQ
jgi:hypothetical protein